MARGSERNAEEMRWKLSGGGGGGGGGAFCCERGARMEQYMALESRLLFSRV